MFDSVVIEWIYNVKRVNLALLHIVFYCHIEYAQRVNDIIIFLFFFTSYPQMLHRVFIP